MNVNKEVELITKKLIKIKKSNYTFVELFNTLTKNRNKEEKLMILTYIPKVLAEKGYEIVNKDNFELRKY